MKSSFAMSCLVAGMLLGPVTALALDDQDTDRSHPKSFVKDSAITAKIKTRLAEEHVASLGHIHVDTDQNGAVWLSGTARTQEAIEKAGAIARETERVTAVHNHIKIKHDE